MSDQVALVTRKEWQSSRPSPQPRSLPWRMSTSAAPPRRAAAGGGRGAAPGPPPVFKSAAGSAARLQPVTERVRGPGRVLRQWGLVRAGPRENQPHGIPPCELTFAPCSLPDGPPPIGTCLPWHLPPLAQNDRFSRYGHLLLAACELATPFDRLLAVTRLVLSLACDLLSPSAGGHSTGVGRGPSRVSAASSSKAHYKEGEPGNERERCCSWHHLLQFSRRFICINLANAAPGSTVLLSSHA